MSVPDEAVNEVASQTPNDRVLDFRPAIAMRWEITRSSADSGGALFETVWWLGPHTGGPPIHMHPTAEESYEVLEGTQEVFINGRWSTLKPGEKVTVPPGTRHTLRNSSDADVRLINIHQPALRFEQMFRDLQRLASSGKVKHLPPQDPRSLIYLGILFDRYSEEQSTTPKAVFMTLSLVGRALGMRA
jgi:mannose-6-phosphate isomerase-like protein (cupin superfamily)